MKTDLLFKQRVFYICNKLRDMETQSNGHAKGEFFQETNCFTLRLFGHVHEGMTVDEMHAFVLGFNVSATLERSAREQ